MDDLDDRNLGVQLEFWHLQEDAPGMVFWHPRGYAVYRALEDTCDRPALRCVSSAESGLKLICPRVPVRPRGRGRETISTSRSKAVRNDTRRSTEYSRKVPLNSRETSGWLMPINSPALA
jgi:hypothetical protein